MARIRPSHYVLGIQGLALLRSWFRGEEAATPHLEELARTMASVAALIGAAPLTHALDGS